MAPRAPLCAGAIASPTCLGLVSCFSSQASPLSGRELFPTIALGWCIISTELASVICQSCVAHPVCPAWRSTGMACSGSMCHECQGAEKVRKVSHLALLCLPSCCLCVEGRQGQRGSTCNGSPTL